MDWQKYPIDIFYPFPLQTSLNPKIQFLTPDKEKIKDIIEYQQIICLKIEILFSQYANLIINKISIFIREILNNNKFLVEYEKIILTKSLILNGIIQKIK